MRSMTLILLAIAITAAADRETVVIGTSDQPFPKVRLTEHALHRRFETTGDARGYFRLEKVDPGVYDVTIAVDGFREKKIADVHLISGQRLDLGLVQMQVLSCEDPRVICCLEVVGYSPVHAQGSITIAPQCSVDIDEGKSFCSAGQADPESDFRIRAEAGGKVFLVPLNGARLSLNPPGDRDESGCSLAEYSSREVGLNDLPLGSRVCIRTTKNRYTQINAFDIAEGGTVRMYFIVWPDPFQIRPAK